MAKSSLDNSAQAEKPHFASRILLTHVEDGYAIVRIRLGDYFARCNPSLIHDYLWTLGDLIEQAQAQLDSQWKAKILELVETLSE